MSGTQMVKGMLREPIHIWETIFNFCNFKSKLSLQSSCSILYDNLFVTDLLNIDDGTDSIIISIPTDDILKQKKYRYLEKIGRGQ
jgi:hypothetical protein